MRFVPVLGKAIDVDPVHVVVAEGVGDEMNFGRGALAADFDHAGDGLVDDAFGAALVTVLGMRADDAAEEDAFVLERFFHDVGCLLLRVVFTVVSDGGTVIEIGGIERAIVQREQFALPIGEGGDFIVGHFQELGAFGEACAGAAAAQRSALCTAKCQQPAPPMEKPRMAMRSSSM